MVAKSSWPTLVHNRKIFEEKFSLCSLFTADIEQLEKEERNLMNIVNTGKILNCLFRRCIFHVQALAEGMNIIEISSVHSLFPKTYCGFIVSRHAISEITSLFHNQSSFFFPLFLFGSECRVCRKMIANL